MSGEELKAIYEQLDERGKHLLETIAVAELKHVVEGPYMPHSDVLNDSEQHSAEDMK